MHSAPNVITRRKRQTPLAGLASQTYSPKEQQPLTLEAAQLAFIQTEERYSSFYKTQLRVAVFDDFASFSGGVHKYADHIVSELVSRHDRDPMSGFQEAWVQSPDAASHPFHGRNLRNFLAGKDSAHAVWAVLDLYLKATNPKLAAGFKLDGYLERLGLTLSEFAEPSANPEGLREVLFEIEDTEDESLRAFLYLRPLPGRSFGLARLIRQPLAITMDEEEDVPEGLEDRRLASGVGVAIPARSGFALVVKDPDTDDLTFGRIPEGGLSVVMMAEKSMATRTLIPRDESALPASALTSWMGDPS